MKEKLVVVGNGMAGGRCIEEILKQDADKFEVTVIGSERHVTYNRILLSSVLQGETSIEDIHIHRPDWYKEHNIQLCSGETVVRLDPAAKTVTTDKNRELSYDKIILATGSSPFILPVPGSELNGVIGFRTIDDCLKIVEVSRKYKKAAVIGGGLLGLEAARGLLNSGMEATIIHNTNQIMDRQLDSISSTLLQKELEKQGMNFLLNKQTERLAGGGRVEKVLFKDGTETDADLVIMAVGVRPNTSLALESGIKTNRAILVDDFMQTNWPGVYAVGECAEHKGVVYGLVKPLYEQGKVLAKHICGKNSDGYRGTVLSAKLKISGVNVFSAGKLDNGPFTKAITLYDESEKAYKKVVFQHNKIIGALLYGDTSRHLTLLDMIAKKKEFTDSEKLQLLDSSKDAVQSAADLPAGAMVCQCNGVSKKYIIETAANEGLTTVDQIRTRTRASSSCGGCKPLLIELLTGLKSGKLSGETIKEALCSCTDLTEDEAIDGIQHLEIRSALEARKALGWKNPEGCKICRPAMDYYLGMIDPGFAGAGESIFIGEKMNAFRQKDGKYSLVPQMYGGITDAEQLGKIAEVVKKYRYEKIIITEDQRIQVTGISEDHLPDIWNDLKMKLIPFQPNSRINVFAYDHEDCQCDSQDHLQLAFELEQAMELLRAPFKVEIGLSPCRYKDSEFYKDIEILKSGRGWEVYVGGSRAPGIKGGELLTVAASSTEAIKLICGFIQYYRETAKHRESVWKWGERVGLIHIREVLFDSELSKVLYQRSSEETARMKQLGRTTVQ
ncbi:nitrite reductase large subunit NirB [Mesobacillus harenae]|uniref:nitrite reductase large subunit NirB n=1 Tax=Mesobacillus harenae TaxID=2213203 RepID=UPI0030CE83FF